MKKFALICLLALPLAAYPQQEASAWCSFNIGGSCSFNMSFSKGCGGFNFSAPPSYPPSCMGCAGSGYDQAWSGGMNYDSAYAAAPEAAPTAAAPAKTLATQYQPDYNAASGYLPVGYYYPSAGYSYGQAPAYWYGR
jgi:hypothetical protein